MSNENFWIGVANFKGGVGKTVVVMHLANAFAAMGKKVLVIDSDPNKSCLNWASEWKDDYAPFRVASLMASSRIKGDWDITILDTPGKSDPQQIHELSKTVNFVIVPVKADRISLEPTVQVCSMLRELEMPFAVLINDYLPTAGVSRGTAAANMCEEADIPYFQTMVPRSMKFVDAQDRRIMVDQITGGRSLAIKFESVAQEIIKDVIGKGEAINLGGQKAEGAQQQQEQSVPLSKAQSPLPAAAAAMTGDSHSESRDLSLAASPSDFAAMPRDVDAEDHILEIPFNRECFEDEIERQLDNEIKIMQGGAIR